MNFLENRCQKKKGWNLLIALIQSFCYDSDVGWEQHEMMEEGLDRIDWNDDFIDPHGKPVF